MIYFIIFQFINVISSTIKSIVVIKSSPIVAAIVTSLHYTLYAIVVKFVSTQDLLVVIITTFITNLLGVPLAKILLNKLEKDKLWVYNVTIKTSKNSIESLSGYFKEHNINNVYQEIVLDKLYYIKIFSTTKQDSSYIKNELKNYSCKFHIIQPHS